VAMVAAPVAVELEMRTVSAPSLVEVDVATLNVVPDFALLMTTTSSPLPASQRSRSAKRWPIRTTHGHCPSLRSTNRRSR
jgi:hypothetical protein